MSPELLSTVCYEMRKKRAIHSSEVALMNPRKRKFAAIKIFGDSKTPFYKKGFWQGLGQSPDYTLLVANALSERSARAPARYS